MAPVDRLEPRARGRAVRLVVGRRPANPLVEALGVALAHPTLAWASQKPVGGHVVRLRHWGRRRKPERELPGIAGEALAPLRAAVRD